MKPTGILLRLAIAASSAALALLLSEGAYSLATGGSLVERIASRGGPMTLVDEPGPSRAASGDSPTTGPWAIDPDPDVGMTMVANAERRIVGEIATTDAWGQRKRPGLRPQPGALRVVVLGDSVAFGYGVGDEETFAHQLELALAGTVADDVPAPGVFTVACPGWNTRNQVRYLLDHFGRLRPDVVVMLPVENDLDDQYRINEHGVRGVAFDPALAPDRPHVCSEHWVRNYTLVSERTPDAEHARREEHGHVRNSVGYAALTGLSPESVRRWDETVGFVEQLARRLEVSGGHLLVALRSREPFESMFDARVRERLPDVPTLTFFEEFLPEDALPTDSHPNPDYTRAGGTLLARVLVERGWVPSADAARLPELAPRFATRRVERESSAALAARLAAHEATWREFFEPEIDLGTGRGFHQILGGAEDQGSVGRHLWFTLAADEPTALELRIRRLPASAGLGPLELDVEINGVATGTYVVPERAADEDAELTLEVAIPPSVRDAAYLDALVRSSNWTVLTAPPPWVDPDAPRIGLVVRRKTMPVAYYFVGARLLRR